VLGLTLMALVATGVALADLHTPPRVDPAPYERVHDLAIWRPAVGRPLAFALLGQADEPRARVIAVYESTAAGWERRFLDRERGTHPWAIRLAELDGDSLPEVVVGVYKSSRYDSIVRNRIFVFDWTGSTIVPKWLGSRLAFAIDSFTFAPGPGGRSRLVVTDMPAREIARRATYQWNGFGFTLVDTTRSARR
jgi:hypothetical protein